MRFGADELQTYCHPCYSPLLARYDLDNLAREVERERFAERPNGIWRWRELLPVRDSGNQIQLGEGDTPLLRAANLGDWAGLEALYIKDESLNPTGTFKARGLSVAVSRAGELGAAGLCIPTAGNAGGALAVYAAAARLKARVFMPQDAPSVNRAEVQACGVDLVLVDGLIDEAGRQAAGAARTEGWFNLSTFKEPYRVEGKKTMGFELAEAFAWDLPEWIFYPTGGGTGMVAMWKAFEELQALGWINERRPHMVCVQAEGCAPLVKAFEQGDERAVEWADPDTKAHGLRVPAPFADRLILRALRESAGAAIAVSEDEIRAAQNEIAQLEGVLACPEGAATYAGLKRMVQADRISPTARVVLFNTGSGLKYMQ
jgi:threonine synthase